MFKHAHKCPERTFIVKWYYINETGLTSVFKKTGLSIILMISLLVAECFYISTQVIPQTVFRALCSLNRVVRC